MQSSIGQQNMPQPQLAQQQSIQQTAPAQQQIMQPQYQTVPVPQTSAGQNVQVPNYSGVNIQIFNPSVATPGATAPVYNVNAPNYADKPVSGCYPPNYYITQPGSGIQNGNITGGSNGGENSAGQNSAINSTENKSSDKKTEKREIVQLTDDYIRNLENYLNSQDKEIRLMGAKEVVARLEEDESRKDDKALNALINKMLQDPSTSVRILALSALDSRAATGDSYTVALLKQMQNSKTGYGQDAMQATNILLKMSGQKVEKEFEVKNSKKTETKTKTGEK